MTDHAGSTLIVRLRAFCDHCFGTATHDDDCPRVEMRQMFAAVPDTSRHLLIAYWLETVERLPSGTDAERLAAHIVRACRTHVLLAAAAARDPKAEIDRLVRYLVGRLLPAGRASMIDPAALAELPDLSAIGVDIDQCGLIREHLYERTRSIRIETHRLLEERARRTATAQERDVSEIVSRARNSFDESVKWMVHDVLENGYDRHDRYDRYDRFDAESVTDFVAGLESWLAFELEVKEAFVDLDVACECLDPAPDHRPCANCERCPHAHEPEWGCQEPWRCAVCGAPEYAPSADCASSRLYGCDLISPEQWHAQMTSG